jgi:hypothetical protein
MCRALFFVKERSLDAVWVAFEGKRAVFEMRQEDGRNFYEIIDDLALGEAGPGVEDFIEIGNFHSLSRDFDFGYLAHELLSRSNLALCPNQPNSGKCPLAYGRGNTRGSGEMSEAESRCVVPNSCEFV